MQDEAEPGSNGTSPKRRRRQRKPAVGLRARRGVARRECRTPSNWTTVELSRSTASVQQHRLIKEQLRCHHVQLNVVETIMGWKEQRGRERKKAAKGSHALSGFGFLPKKRSWSDGDLNVTATSQRQLVKEDSSSRSSRQLQEQDEGSSLQSSSSTQVSVKLIVIFVPAGPQNVSPVLNGLALLRATAKSSNYPSL